MTMNAISARRVSREIGRWIPDFREALANEPEAEAVVADARDHIVAIARTTPDPGWAAPHMRAFTLGGMVYVAFYLALAPRGYDAARAWTVCEAATRRHFERMRGLERKIAVEGLFGWPALAMFRWLARRSQRTPVGGWVFTFVEGSPGRFDYGIDYQRCAIREMAIAQGAADFAPFICLADVSGSETFGWGLARNETIAQGGRRCDFRFQRGGETRIRVRLPLAE